MEIREDRIDGVPVFFAEGPGPLTAGLVFRVGQADEPLTRRGLTHLVEHLALAPLADLRSYNGRVTLTETAFEVDGEPDEVRDFCNRVAQSLAALPVDRLDIERRVLRTEDQRRGGSLSSLAHYLRFGPAGPGTVDCPELGLHGATPERVEAWCGRYFTRGNAALWVSGPPPEGIDLSPLTDGERVSPPAHEPYPYRYPAWYPGSDTYVAVSLLVDRSTAAWAAGAILRERLYDRLRAAEGRAYDVSIGYEALTADEAAILFVTDTLPEEAERVRDAVSVEITRLARGGPTQEELDELLAWRARRAREPSFPAHMAERYARETLLGGEVRSAGALDAALAATTPAEVGAAMRKARRSALWLVPGAIGMNDRRVELLPPASSWAVEGREFDRPPNIEESLVGDRLIVGADGLSIVENDGRLLTVERDGCCAVQAYDDGARVLWGADGLRLFIHPAAWARGDDAIAAIDELIDPGLVVPMGEDSGYEPPEAASDSAGDGGLLRRWRRR